MNHVDRIVLQRVILIDSKQIPRHFPLKNNIISIASWENNNPRDHVLKDLLAILK